MYSFKKASAGHRKNYADLAWLEIPDLSYKSLNRLHAVLLTTKVEQRCTVARAQNFEFAMRQSQI